MSLNRRAFCSTLTASVLAGCTAPRNIVQLTDNVMKWDGSLKHLKYDSWPTTGRDKPYYSPDELEEIPDIQTYKGESGATHAVKTARELSRVAQSIRYAESGEYEATANRLTDAFVESATETGGSLFFPYEFNFPLHGIDDELMTNPWYSGMAQGLALAAFARLQHLTDGERFPEIASRTYQSLRQVRRTSSDKPWVSTVDDGYYWIEEYPIHPAAHTLNGKIFAIYGLYEYWRVTGRNDVEETIQKALATVIAHLPEFRREGDISQYCLKHADVQSGKYHHIHIEQLNQLHKMTGDTRFNKWADRLKSDYWKPDKY